ncbi:hypothetical protein Lmor_1933 [Legionella moravica]|uniref:Uncharacterized protein n=2 Tax=Legionella moravica TaxID=39962 RepID=A0A378JUQ6_9GAMM|nr:hypothetical protein [Legionella moravica]KTD33951.1 hypothetical protein Lmor_1933 [Legionella moravica]STX61192.1 Uncharacterised protein [Legionella moravica]
MFARNFYHMLRRSMPHTKELSNVHIGRMAAETTEDIIRKELEDEIKKAGWQSIRDRIQAEELVLVDLSYEKHQLQLAMETSCLNPSIERARQGFAVRGLFWEEMQKNLNHIAPLENIQVLEEQIDWLNTRQKIFEEIQARPSIGAPSSRF